MAQSSERFEGGFDVQLVNSNVEKTVIECPICRLVFREPVQAVPCGHRFCNCCIQQDKRINGRNKIFCPIDRLEVQKHQQQCPMKILKCALECGNEIILRGEMDHHLEHYCTANIKKCKYFVIGCQFEGKPKALKDHIKENIDHHMFLQVGDQAKAYEKIRKLEEDISKKEKLIRCLTASSRSQEYTINRMNLKTQELEEKIQSQDDKINKQNELISSQIIPLKDTFSILRTCPFEFNVKNVADLLTDRLGGVVCSDPFYFLNGYLGMLRVCLNGVGEEYRNYISVFFHILKGPFDEYLDWPMLFAEISFKMLVNGDCVNESSFNCNEHRETLREVFTKPINHSHDTTCWGFMMFFRHDDMPVPNLLNEITFVVDVTKV